MPKRSGFRTVILEIKLPDLSSTGSWSAGKGILDLDQLPSDGGIKFQMSRMNPEKSNRFGLPAAAECRLVNLRVIPCDGRASLSGAKSEACDQSATFCKTKILDLDRKEHLV